MGSESRYATKDADTAARRAQVHIRPHAQVAAVRLRASGAHGAVQRGVARDRKVRCRDAVAENRVTGGIGHAEPDARTIERSFDVEHAARRKETAATCGASERHVAAVDLSTGSGNIPRQRDVARRDAQIAGIARRASGACQVDRSIDVEGAARADVDRGVVFSKGGLPAAQRAVAAGVAEHRIHPCSQRGETGGRGARGVEALAEVKAGEVAAGKDRQVGVAAAGIVVGTGQTQVGADTGAGANAQLRAGQRRRHRGANQRVVVAVGAGGQRSAAE